MANDRLSRINYSLLLHVKLRRQCVQDAGLALLELQERLRCIVHQDLELVKRVYFRNKSPKTSRKPQT